jgi:DNA-3-methyladenine glycosylase
MSVISRFNQSGAEKHGGENRSQAPFVPLPRSFYRRPTLEVARGLLGTTLVRHLDDRILAGRIVEAEAYIGEEDPACHAHHGLTTRTQVMYGPPGYAYVYFTYGMHFLLNAVTEREGFPAAVLIRAVEPLVGITEMRRLRGHRADRELTSGPARLSAAFDIDLGLNRADLTCPPLFIAEPIDAAPGAVRWTARIGIRSGRRRPWRCFLEGNPFVSRGRPGIAPARRRRKK